MPYRRAWRAIAAGSPPLERSTIQIHIESPSNGDPAVAAEALPRCAADVEVRLVLSHPEGLGYEDRTGRSLDVQEASPLAAIHAEAPLR